MRRRDLRLRSSDPLAYGGITLEQATSDLLNREAGDKPQRQCDLRLLG